MASTVVPLEMFHSKIGEDQISHHLCFPLHHRILRKLIERQDRSNKRDEVGG